MKWWNGSPISSSAGDCEVTSSPSFDQDCMRHFREPRPLRSPLGDSARPERLLANADNPAFDNPCPSDVPIIDGAGAAFGGAGDPAMERAPIDGLDWSLASPGKSGSGLEGLSLFSGMRDFDRPNLRRILGDIDKSRLTLRPPTSRCAACTISSRSCLSRIPLPSASNLSNMTRKGFTSAHLTIPSFISMPTTNSILSTPLPSISSDLISSMSSCRSRISACFSSALRW
mmetsp:Transcript_57243/g.170276  ORF Transcript_57243/g.170276 Transcript_57243/m.170276 type:complete len:229 (-) Transcript_57243:86-772(-)